MSQSVEESLKERSGTVEAAYEFMLAYAAQGATGEEEGGSGIEIRAQLKRFEGALEGLAELFKELIVVRDLKPTQRYNSFIDLLGRDAGFARAAIQLVLAQPVISSQVIDNLNAVIHVRSLLTDLFLIGEILRL